MSQPPSPGILYIVPTPIGNYEDISPRAARILGEVDVIAAEDTRETAMLLRHLQLNKSMLSYHDHNEGERTRQLVNSLRQGRNIALVSDAGTPLLDDPGYRLVAAVVSEGLPLVSLPGPCAALTALTGSGLPTDRFYYLGFLPRSTGEREGLLTEVKNHPSTLLFYEAPHRTIDTLISMEKVLGDRPATLAINLTKEREAWHRGTLSSLRTLLQSREFVSGEITLVVGGALTRDEGPLWAKAEQVMDLLLGSGVEPRIVRDTICTTLDLRKREVYQRILARVAEGDEEEET